MLKFYKCLHKIYDKMSNFFLRRERLVRKRITFHIAKQLKKHFPEITFYILYTNYEGERQYSINYDPKYDDNEQLEKIVVQYTRWLWENRMIDIIIMDWNDEEYLERSENRIGVI